MSYISSKLLLLFAISVVQGFLFVPQIRYRNICTLLKATQSGGGVDEEDSWLDEIQWRIQRSRLSYYNSKQVLRRKRLFLPYTEACKWVQAMGQWSTKEEWRNWVASGEKRNPYIPNRPDVCYADEWKGWSHFLLGVEEVKKDHHDET
mmetsp:Transcript_21754/g.28162  ORF Transcript_21754/g.28162 Transcript_21754/m.28162 type:complete len:148 (-) Transcript_21754:3217-3660(-)